MRHRPYPAIEKIVELMSAFDQQSSYETSQAVAPKDKVIAIVGTQPPRAA
jgi:hypothetical protein